MSLPTNKKKNDSLSAKNLKNLDKNSKMMKGASKPAGVAKKVRSTGANRGS